jgi:hypothetical protein
MMPRHAVLGLLVLSATSCFTMQSVSMDDLGARTSRVWVKQADQSVVVVSDAQVFRGNLVGFVDGKYRELPPDAVQEVLVRKLSSARTASLVAAGVAGFAGALLLLSGGADHFDDCAGGEEECDGGIMP